MAKPVLDDFTRPDEPLVGNGYTQIASNSGHNVAVNANTCTWDGINTLGGDHCVAEDTETYDGDHIATCTLGDLTAGSSFQRWGVSVRCQPGGDHCGFRVRSKTGGDSGFEWQHFETISGTVDVKNSSSVTGDYNTGDIVSHWAEGNTVYVAINGVVVNSFITVLTGGRPGLCNRNVDGMAITAASFDDLDGGGGDPAPDITDVDTDEAITATQTNVAITGTDFDGAEVNIEQDAVAIPQSIDSQNATGIQFDVVFDTGGGPHLKYGAATLRVTNADDQDDTIAITIDPPSGKAFVDIDTPDAEAENRITAVDDIETGDQLEISNAQGGTIDDVVLNADGTFDCDEAVTAFDVRCWDAEDQTWGSIGTQTVGEPDDVPSAFSFNDETDVPLSTQQTSDPITVAGINMPVAITVAGGQYSINGGSFSSSPGTVENGDEVRARHTSSASYSMAVGTVVTIGGVSDIFTSTTEAAPAPPVFSGTIPNRALALDVAISPIDTGANFTGADEYSLAGTLPTGLSFDDETGVISGTPTEEGVFDGLVVTATNGDGSDDSNEFTLRVTELQGYSLNHRALLAFTEFLEF